MTTARKKRKEPAYGSTSVVLELAAQPGSRRYNDDPSWAEAEAAKLCGRCEKPIGFCCRYYGWPDGQVEHAACYEDAEAEHEREKWGAGNVDRAAKTLGLTQTGFRALPRYEQSGHLEAALYDFKSSS